MVVDLAVAFIETFGEWAAKERDAKIGNRGPYYLGVGSISGSLSL